MSQINHRELRSSSIAFIGNSLHVNPPTLPKPSFRDYKYIYKKKVSVKDFLQFLQEQIKHLQSGLNLRRAVTFLFVRRNVKQLQLTVILTINKAEFKQKY